MWVSTLERSTAAIWTRRSSQAPLHGTITYSITYSTHARTQHSKHKHAHEVTNSLFTTQSHPRSTLKQSQEQQHKAQPAQPVVTGPHISILHDVLLHEEGFWISPIPDHPQVSRLVNGLWYSDCVLLVCQSSVYGLVKDSTLESRGGDQD